MLTGVLTATGWIEPALLIAAASTRIAVAFLLIPIFATDIVPPLVRNSVFLALGLVSASLQPPLATATLAAADWARLLLKEAFVGIAIGFFFGSILWALESAGAIIDQKVGATIGQIMDPITGNQTSLTGAFLARLANLVFLFSGGLGVLLSVLLQSYAIWPISPEWPHLSAAAPLLFEREFGRLLAIATLFAAPVLIILTIVDAGFGLMNRFASQVNVFQLSMGLKAWLAIFLVMLMVGSVVEAVIADIASRAGLVPVMLKEL